MPPENQQEKPFFRFSRDGQAVFQEWLTRLQREKLTDERDHSIILEHLAKYRSLMPSLALVFHLIECADQGRSPDPVSRDAQKKRRHGASILKAMRGGFTRLRSTPAGWAAKHWQRRSGAAHCRTASSCGMCR